MTIQAIARMRAAHRCRAISFGIVIAALFAVGSLGLPEPASAEEASPAPLAGTWTWDSTTHPAGAGNINGGSLGGVFFSGGMYYVPSVGHMTSALGEWKEEHVSGSGSYGYAAYSAHSGSLDTGMIATGTQPIAPILRVADSWQNAPIMDVAHVGEIVAGAYTCHSGSSVTTQNAGGVRCGQITGTCMGGATTCAISASTGIVQGGDSGGPVWQYTPGGVKLLGWMKSANPSTALPGGDPSFPNYSSGTFTPVWALQNHAWTAAETWAGRPDVAPFPTGEMTSGCFVTFSGCVRS